MVWLAGVNIKRMCVPYLVDLSSPFRIFLSCYVISIENSVVNFGVFFRALVVYP